MKDHSGDLALALRGKDLAGLLSDGALAFAEAVGAPERGRTRSVTIRIAAVDLEDLVVVWLNELIVLVETKGLVPISADVRVTDDPEAGDRYTAWASVMARKPAPGYAPLALPKAATYHGLAVRKTRTGWRAKVILDL